MQKTTNSQTSSLKNQTFSVFSQDDGKKPLIMNLFNAMN